MAYARSLDLWGKAAKFDVIASDSKLSGSAIYQGAPVQRDVAGFGDPLMRLSVILHGAPAMTPAAFRSYRQDVIVGASLQVSVPLGQYDPTRLVNIGTNRWSFKPEIGISKAIGRWSFEAQAAATVYTENPDFFRRRATRSPATSIRVRSTPSIISGPVCGIPRRHLLHRRQPRPPNQWDAPPGPAAELADRDHPCRAGQSTQFDQVLRQQRRLGPDRQQLQCHWGRLAIPLETRPLGFRPNYIQYASRAARRRRTRWYQVAISSTGGDASEVLDDRRRSRSDVGICSDLCRADLRFRLLRMIGRAPCR